MSIRNLDVTLPILSPPLYVMAAFNRDHSVGREFLSLSLSHSHSLERVPTACARSLANARASIPATITAAVAAEKWFFVVSTVHYARKIPPETLSPACYTHKRAAARTLGRGNERENDLDAPDKTRAVKTTVNRRSRVNLQITILLLTEILYQRQIHQTPN